MQNSRSEHITCAHCRYFRSIDRTTGTCHRFPPAFAGNHSPREDHHWRFPMVNNQAWCGEFVEADEAK